MVFRGRLRECSQGAFSPAGQPWWDELTLDAPEYERFKFYEDDKKELALIAIKLFYLI